MLVWLSLRWWYGAGWQWAFKRAIVDRLHWCNENFSILGLMRTWLAPFKQTYSGASKGSLDIQIHAFFDNVISRLIGAVARTFIIAAGLVASLFVIVSGALFVVLWPLIPLALPASLVLLALGVGK
jgi:hypothetical protein